LSLLKPLCLFLISGLGASQTIAQASKLEPLKRPAALKKMKGTSADAIASLLAQANMAGGIISTYSDCGKPKEHLFVTKSGTLQDNLDYVSSLDASQAWIYENGVILAGFKQAPKTLLATTISEVKIDPNETLSLATQRLLGSSELREVIARTGVEESASPLGYSSVPSRQGAYSTTKEDRQPEVLYGKTFEEALNALALSRNSAVWHYEQYVCGKRSSFRVSWVVSGSP